MRRLHALPAALALLGLLLPWAHFVAVSAHAASHDDAGSQHHAAELADAFHGHHHSEGETDHRHSLVAFDLAAQRAKSIDRVGAPACTQPIARPWSSPLADAITRGRGPADSGHGPPGVSFQMAILRV
jgi:hypothetical protein